MYVLYNTIGVLGEDWGFFPHPGTPGGEGGGPRSLVASQLVVVCSVVIHRLYTYVCM